MRYLVYEVALAPEPPTVQAAANRLSSSNQNRGERRREEAFPWFEKWCTAGYRPHGKGV